MLDDEKNNFLSSIYVCESGFGVCFCDVSTGEIFITDIVGNDKERLLVNEFSSFMPREIIVNNKLIKTNYVKKFIKSKMLCLINILDL